MTTTPTQRRRRAPRNDAADRPTLTATGTVKVHPRGFGFAEFDDGTSAFIPPPMLETALAGDTADVTYVEEADGRATAQKLTVTHRARTELFGVLDAGPNGLLLDGDAYVTNTRWAVTGNGAPGAAARCEWDGTAWRIADVYPDPTSVEALWARIMARHQIVDGDSGAALTEADTIADTMTVGGEGRRDLRNLPTFTVDAAHSRDLDDAISVAAADSDGAVRVWVHIADVADVIREGTALDDQARAYGTSVYLPGRTRPMLPRILSEQALSLLAGVDRNTLTVEMRLAGNGDILSVDVYESIICSDGRLDYHTVGNVLEGGHVPGLDADADEALGWLRAVWARLSLARNRRGGVETRRVEPERAIEIVGGELDVVDAELTNRGHEMIERLMVAANESVAQWLGDRGVPTLYRTHDAPGADAATAIETYVSAIGMRCGFGGELDAAGLATLDLQLAGQSGPVADGVWNVLLGHLGRARYTPERGAHFGLGSPLYTHFTSPIRRYADIVVHRSVKAYLHGARNEADYPSVTELTAVADDINELARSAGRAEADMRTAAWLVELSTRTGEPLPAMVTGIGPKAVFASLDGIGVSGSVMYATLPGRWDPNEDRTSASSDRGSRLVIGERIDVRIDTVDVARGDLVLVTGNHQTSAAHSSGGRNQGGRNSGRRRNQRNTQPAR